MEMISRRLTNTQKAEILSFYRAGENTNFLAEKYSCTTNTINRTVKTLLSDDEYKLLKKKRSKLGNGKIKLIDQKNLIENKRNLNLELEDKLDTSEVDKMVAINSKENSFAEFGSQNIYDKNQDREIHNQTMDTNFELIEPLISDFDFNQDKKKAEFEISNQEILPDSVYMLVDKKVELEIKSISDLPEWSFLPENELKRNAILLFSNQRTAKRSCSRNQRVIKIPNTYVFEVSKSYLLSKGITRLIIEDSIIALDN